MSLLDIADIRTLEQYERYYRVTISSNFLLIPATVLIASYDRFKKWIRYCTLISVIPFLIASVMFLFGVRDYTLLESIVNTGAIFISLCWLFWAYNIYDNYRIDNKAGTVKL